MQNVNKKSINQSKDLAHYTQNCKKHISLPYTLQLLFTTATSFPTDFFMSNNTLSDFFRKIFAVLCIVCKGLWMPWMPSQCLLYSYNVITELLSKSFFHINNRQYFCHVRVVKVNFILYLLAYDNEL